MACVSAFDVFVAFFLASLGDVAFCVLCMLRSVCCVCCILGGVQALGRDYAGGQSVNLTPSPVPQDVYSGEY